MIEITLYRDSKKVLETEVNTGSLRKQSTNLFLLSISPTVWKLFIELVATYPILKQYWNIILGLNSENALELIGYFQHLISKGLI